MVRPNKALGQHFLRDPSVIERAIGALDVTPEDTVLEIGPGQGVYTLALAAHAKHVVAIELDRVLAQDLRFTMPRNVEVIQGDALAADPDTLPAFDLVTGNLPYQISSPLTFKLLDWSWRKAVFLYQLEFAQRLVAAGPDDPHYGRLSITRAYRAEGHLLRKVKPGAFVPAPKVMSGLVELVPHAAEPFDIGYDGPWHTTTAEEKADKKAAVAWFDTLVRECFTQRRKTLRKALMNQADTLGLTTHAGDAIDAWLVEAGLSDLRVDQVSPEGYGRLAKVLAADRREA